MGQPLPATEFVQQLTTMLSGLDPYMKMVTDHFEEQVRKYGDMKAFLNQNIPEARYLVDARHKASIFFNFADKFDKLRHMPRKHEYLELATEALDETEFDHKKLFEQYPNFTKIDGALRPECLQALATIADCKRFVADQCALAGVERTPRRSVS